jgi:hypothetical protein
MPTLWGLVSPNKGNLILKSDKSLVGFGSRREAIGARNMFGKSKHEWKIGSLKY